LNKSCVDPIITGLVPHGGLDERRELGRRIDGPRRDIETLSLRLTVRMGVVAAAGSAELAAGIEL
jgi:hypothetical protein